jgi:hypothetical protein
MRTLLCLVFLVACGSSGRSAIDASVPEDATSGDGGPIGEQCGGFIHRECAATEYCDFPDNDCGAGDQSGVCKPRPAACPAVVGPPTCGCDGKVYAGECPAFVEGNDLDASGSCEVMTGRFACGYLQCSLATQYCRREPHAGAAETFSCVNLPSACSGSSACGCLADERCGDACAGDARVGLTLRCPTT